MLINDIQTKKMSQYELYLKIYYYFCIADVNITFFDMNLANNIKAQARLHNIKITDIAKTLGVLQPQLSRTINNPRISLEDLEKIANAIGCKVSDFFKSESEVETIIRCNKCGNEIKVKFEQ